MRASVLYSLTTALLSAALWLPNSARACSCVPAGSPQQELANSAQVFRGRMVANQEVGSNREFSFQVSRVWKGAVEPLKTLATPAAGSVACGRTFVPNAEYLVYAESGGWVYICGRTALISDAQADLSALGNGEIPQLAATDRVVLYDRVVGVWYNPLRDGEGVFVEMLQDGRAAVYWFTYTPDEPTQQAWLYGVGSFDGDLLSIDPVYQPQGGRFGIFFNPNAVERLPWGRLSMRFKHDGTTRLSWASDKPMYGAGNVDLIRMSRPPNLPLLLGN